MATFGSVQIRNMVAVGSVTPNSVRLWFRTEVPGEHKVDVFDSGSSPVQCCHANRPMGLGSR